MDGSEVAAGICARWPIPVVYFTGHSQPIILKGVRTYGPVLYSRKLVNEQALGETIATTLSLPPTLSL
jgi:hypothetical protein